MFCKSVVIPDIHHDSLIDFALDVKVFQLKGATFFPLDDTWLGLDAGPDVAQQALKWSKLKETYGLKFTEAAENVLLYLSRATSQQAFGQPI